MTMPTDEQIVAHAGRLRLLAAETGASEVLLARRLLQLADDPAAVARWPVELGRVSRLREARRQARSRSPLWH